MTSRERWILYPLLFLTLGIVMRDKVWPQRRFDAREIAAEKVAAYREITADKIRCNQLDVAKAECRQLAVTGSKGNEGVRMGVVPDGGGWLEVCGRQGQKVVVAGADQTGKSGVLETFNADEVPQVQLWSDQSGGMVTAVGRDRTIWLSLGHSGENYGVFMESSELGRRILLTAPLRFDTSPPPPKPPEQQPESSGRRPSKQPVDNAPQ